MPSQRKLLTEYRNGDSSILIAPNQIPGCWIYTKCKKCGKPLQYWSKTGKPKAEYRNAKCADVTGGRKC